MAHTNLTPSETQLLAQIQVRLIEPEQRALWDQSLVEHQSLLNATLVGQVLRYVATTPDGRWVALLG